MDQAEARLPLQKGVDAVWVELLAGLCEELDHGLVPRDRGTVRAVARHRVERVRHGEDARRERDVVPAQPVRIPGSVPALVVVPDDLEAAPVQERDAAQHLLAEDDVGLEDAPLGLGQGPRLAENPVGDPDLADVVKEEAVLDARLLDEPGLDRPGQLHRIALHTVGVSIRAEVLRLECRRQGTDGLAIGGLDQGALSLLELEQAPEVLRVADELLLGRP